MSFPSSKNIKVYLHTDVGLACKIEIAGKTCLNALIEELTEFRIAEVLM
jgi:hypothetical protein